MSEPDTTKKDDIVRNVRAKTIDEICHDIDENFEKKFNAVKEETELAFRIDETDLSGELTKCIYKLHTYLTKLAEETLLLNKISRKRDDIHGELYGQLKKGEQIRFDSKGEVEEWINRNPKWIKITTYYDNQKLICSYYDKVIDAIKQKQWSIRYKIDLKKIELGI